MWLLNVQQKIENDAISARIKEQLGVQKVDGIMKCNGRLTHASIPEEATISILLPRIHNLTKLIIPVSHIRVFRNGVRATLVEVRSIYCIRERRSKVQQIIRDCTQ